MPNRRIHGRAFVRGTIQDDTLVEFDEKRIISVTETRQVPDGTWRTGGVICPGFVDIHIHGGAGADFMDGSVDSNNLIARHHGRHGTTALAATTLSASEADLHTAVKAIATAAARPAVGAAEIVAVHLEGPFINAGRAGAQDRRSIRPADIREVEFLLSLAPRLGWVVTLAPEIEGALHLITRFRGAVRFSIGHTAGSYGDAVTAMTAGAMHFTHLFNAMTGLNHREPGVAGAALTSTEATAELIADGVHVHPAVLRLAVVAMPRRIALVTDAIRACGLGEGTYKLYDHEVQVAGGEARLRDGTLAGSILTMDRAVRNMVELAGIPLETAVPLATEIPARIAGVGDRKGCIESGYDPDFAILDDKLAIERVIVRGKDAA